MVNMNTHGQRMKKELALRAVRPILFLVTLTIDAKVVTLTFDAKVILLISIISCNLSNTLGQTKEGCKED